MKKYLRFLIIAAVMFLVGVFVSLGASAARSGELKPSSDRVIFIKDYQKDDTAGDGSGKDADNPLRLVSHKDYDTTAENSKDYLQTLLYQATEALAETGGTVVICGEVVLEDNPLVFDKYLFRTAKYGEKTIKFTSLYDGVDYRKENGAKLIINTGSYINIYGNSIWENVDLVTEGTFRKMFFNGYAAYMGEGINCYSQDLKFSDNYSGYLSIYGGSYAEDSVGMKTDITVSSGTYCSIYGGGDGTYMEDAETNLTIEGTTKVLGEVCGTSRGANGKFSGNINITINSGVYECDVLGVGTAGIENDDGKVIITINGGDFKNGWSISPMQETDEEGVKPPVYSELNLLGYKSDNDKGLMYLYALVNDFSEVRFTEIKINIPEVTHPPYCEPNAKDTTEDKSVFDTADSTVTVETITEETPICYGDNLSQSSTSSKRTNENRGTKIIIAVAAVAFFAVTVVITVSKKKTK